VQTTGGGDEEAGSLALEPVHGPPQKRQKTVLTVSASLVPGDAGGGAASGTHCAIAEVGVPKSQLCTAAAAAPLLVLQGVSAQQRAKSPVLAPLPASVMAHASVEIEHPIAVGTAQAHLSIADPGTVTATEARTSGFF
jgi:hypothetical protein